MNEDVIRMASMAGFETKRDMAWVDQWEVTRSLERFAALVRADEREACAKVCETHTVDDVLVGVGIAQSCAAAIRARAQQPPATVEDRLARHGIPMPDEP